MIRVCQVCGGKGRVGVDKQRMKAGIICPVCSGVGTVGLRLVRRR